MRAVDWYQKQRPWMTLNGIHARSSRKRVKPFKKT